MSLENTGASVQKTYMTTAIAKDKSQGSLVKRLKLSALDSIQTKLVANNLIYLHQHTNESIFALAYCTNSLKCFF